MSMDKLIEKINEMENPRLRALTEAKLYPRFHYGGSF